MYIYIDQLFVSEPIYTLIILLKNFFINHQVNLNILHCRLDVIMKFI